MVKEGGLPLLVNGVPWVRISVSQARGHLHSWSSPAKLSALDDVKVWIRIKVQGNDLKSKIKVACSPGWDVVGLG